MFNISILGELKNNYKDRNFEKSHDARQRQHRIYEDTDNQTLETMCACYTKNCITDLVHGEYNRQIVHQRVYELAKALDKEADEFPFGRDESHRVILEWDKNNKYDSTAIIIKLNASNKSPLEILNGYHLGYLPMAISSKVCANLNHIRTGKIISVHSNLPNKNYFNTKVIFGFGDNTFSEKVIRNGKRFLSLVDE